MKQCLGFLTSSLVLTCTAWAQDWPQWRGPNRDGVALNAKLPTVWPTQVPKPLWRVEVGEGYSSPVIANGRVYFMRRLALQPPPDNDESEICDCFDADAGNSIAKTRHLIWAHSYKAPYDPHPAARSAGKGPKSTPTVDGDRVYFVGISGMFHCLDARTGEELWKHDFAKEYWGQKGDDGYDSSATYCGASASPLVDGNNVIYPVGGPKAGALTAFDRRTGKIVWRASGARKSPGVLADRSSYASPIIATLAGRRQIVAFTGKRLAGFDPSDGSLLWDYPFPISYDQTIVTPMVWKDHVIICGEGKPATSLRIERNADTLAVSVAWQNKELQSYMTSPVVLKDHLYGLDESGRFICIDLANGKTAWEHGNFGQYASIVVAGDQLLVLSDDGNLHVVDASPKAFKQRAKLRLSEEGGTWAHLAVVGNRLYVKDKHHLICFDFGKAN